jgi:secreted PhoX family phosphatase
MSRFDRRSFLKATTLAGGALGLGALGLRGAHASVPQFGGDIPGFGPLVPTAAENTGEVLLALPEGFKYNMLIRNGDPMTDGRPFPSNADGMGTFNFKDGLVRLVCNHERTGGPAIGNFPWDPLAGGGTTTLTFDPKTRLLTESFVSSSGTIRNCAGGVTPWGSWLTCEENATKPGSKQHGYIFEVPADATGEVAVEPLVNMGLHYPEAAVVDPKTGIVYITSDRGPCGTFRFVPDQYGSLAGTGRVQMLAIKGMPVYDTRAGQQTKVKLPVEWVDIDDPSNEDAYKRRCPVHLQAGPGQGRRHLLSRRRRLVQPQQRVLRLLQRRRCPPRPDLRAEAVQQRRRRPWNWSSSPPRKRLWAHRTTSA